MITDTMPSTARFKVEDRPVLLYGQIHPIKPELVRHCRPVELGISLSKAQSISIPGCMETKVAAEKNVDTSIRLHQILKSIQSYSSYWPYLSNGDNAIQLRVGSST